VRDFIPEIEILPPTKNDFESVLKRASSSPSELGKGKKGTSQIANLPIMLKLAYNVGGMEDFIGKAS